MHANNKISANGVGEVDINLTPFLNHYKDGHIERLLKSPFVAASEDPTANRGVATRDVVIDLGTGVSARLYLPSRATMAGRRLPLVVYIHGGSFCTESAFCRTYHGYATSLAAAAGVLVVSVEYRLAPEHPIPTAYDDAWYALRWAAALSDPWLAGHVDPDRTFLAGDSASGNIAYHTVVRAGRDGMGIEGMIMVQPFFWGAERLPSEEVWDGVSVLDVTRVGLLWPFVTAGLAGNDDPRIKPSDEEIASLTGSSSTTTCMIEAYSGGTLKIGGERGKAAAVAAFKKAKCGLFTGPVRPNKAYKGPSAAALPGGTQVIKNYF
ncbi:unnamed protein product [Urochloa decumbens]|uniref:Alpha/beta hydrolase fold-3 domain-containing protein n=1 Tax=Urochloa decumbens TaxID=240449 RepID=A0ABC9FLP4_9POAL